MTTIEMIIIIIISFDSCNNDKNIQSVEKHRWKWIVLNWILCVWAIEEIYRWNSNIFAFDNNVCAIRRATRPSAIRSGCILFWVVWWKNIVNSSKFNCFKEITSVENIIYIVGVRLLILILTQNARCNRRYQQNYRVSYTLNIEMFEENRNKSNSKKSTKKKKNTHTFDNKFSHCTSNKSKQIQQKRAHEFNVKLIDKIINFYFY